MIECWFITDYETVKYGRLTVLGMQLDATVTFVFEFETQTTTTINLQLTWEEHEILTFVTNLVGAMIDSFAYLRYYRLS